MAKTRKLNRGHHMPLFKLAMEKFIDLDLRAAEDAAVTAFRDAFLVDYERLVAPGVAYLKQIGSYTYTSCIAIPMEIPVLKKGKSFVRPDGVTITRTANVVKIKTGFNRNWEAAYINEKSMRSFIAGSESKAGNASGYGGFLFRYWSRSVDLGRSIVMPYGGVASLSYDSERDDDHKTRSYTLKNGQLEATWISNDTIAAMREMYVASRARQEGEDRLLRAIGTAIMSAETYEELVEIWPEAMLIEGQLFSPPPPREKKALIALNDDDKKALCRSMASRGVEAQMCAA